MRPSIVLVDEDVGGRAGGVLAVADVADALVVEGRPVAAHDRQRVDVVAGPIERRR